MLKVTTSVICFCNNLCNKTHKDRESDKVSVDPPDTEEVKKTQKFCIASTWTFHKNSQRRLQNVKPNCKRHRHHWSWWACQSSSRVVQFKAHCPLAIRPLDINVNKMQLMAKLPTCRLQPFTPPFMFTSCDYFGPIKVKISRNKTAKHYGVLFTCLNMRAIHCELATDAITMEFLQVLRRFFSYRGHPKVMLSDNGSQMVGAERELCLMIEGWDKTKLSEYCAARGMKWQFTTPLAPHENGCSEALVKSTKSAV